MTDVGNGTWNSDGTSMAAPHVAGAVTLLQQYGNYMVQHRGWNGETAPRHEIMKAVVLNSADKFKGIHGSLRTTVAPGNAYDWENSPANTDMAIPLDPWMGAGHMNLGAALKNYRVGEWEAGVVPNIGWDYGQIGANSFETYIFNRSLAAGEVVAATLCWDLRVETISPNPNNHLDGFFDYVDLSQVMNDLDIYLMPVGGDPNDPQQIVEASVSSVDNVEHIFFPVPFGGFWQLVVANTPFGLQDTENYGLAWWAGEAIPGDFDGDGDVDDDDLPSWKTNFGTSEADADYDGDSDGADYLAWQRNYGFNVPPVVAVPEPTSWLLGCCGVLLLWRRRCIAAISAAAVVATAHQANAATTVFTRQSRPATPAEISDGVPAGSMVHDFFATTDADILCIATTFHLPVFKHAYGNDYSPPEQELVNLYPALGASSFLDTPGGTFTLGGNLSTDAEKAWADFSDDGSQEAFLFGRLTTDELGAFSGSFALRGEQTYIELPFTFSLPNEEGPNYESFTVFREEQKIPVITPAPVEPTLPVAPPEPMFPQIVPTFSLPSREGQSALALKRSRMGDDFKFSGVRRPVSDSAWPLPLPTKPAGSQIPESAEGMLTQVRQPDFNPEQGFTAESESPPLPIDNPLDVTGMRAVYDPLTGNVEFEGLTNIHGIGVMTSGDAELNPSGAISAGDMLVANAEEIGWLFMSGIAGGAFDGGAILEPGLSDELSNYFIGVASMGSGKSVTPIPIVSGSMSHLPNFNPFAPVNVAAVPEPSAWMLGVLGLLSLAKRRQGKSRQSVR